jgi:hypothetical protein
MLTVMTVHEVIIEIIGWISTALFLFSILVPNRARLHQLGIGASVTTGYYAYAHGATAIWVKWTIAFFFHGYMVYKTRKTETSFSDR